MQAAAYPGEAAPCFSSGWSPSVVPLSAPSGEVVHLVDNDRRVGGTLKELLASRKIEAVHFASAEEYLGAAPVRPAACLVLDLNLAGMGGLELQRRVAESSPPVVFISGPCDTVSAVKAMKAGALEFLIKPVDPMEFVAAVRFAFTHHRRLRQKRAETAELERRLRLLTPREREVLPLVVGGLLNKQAAWMLGISEVTLQIHRGQVMRKMQAGSFAELVRMAVRLRIPRCHAVGQVGGRLDGIEPASYRYSRGDRSGLKSEGSGWKTAP